MERKKSEIHFVLHGCIHVLSKDQLVAECKVFQVVPSGAKGKHATQWAKGLCRANVGIVTGCLLLGVARESLIYGLYF